MSAHAAAVGAAPAPAPAPNAAPDPAAAPSCSTEVVYLNASSVVAAIGEHTYQPADAAFLTALSYSARWKPVVAAAKAAQAVRTEAEAFAAITAARAEVAAAIEAGAAAAVKAGSDADVKAAIDTAVEAGVKAVGDADAGLVKAGVAQAVAMARGSALEAAALDGYEARRGPGTVVGARNARMTYLRTPRYVVGGRIDGYDAARRVVIEAKNRKRAWASPPAYDLVQVRVYVRMLAEEDAKAKARAKAGAKRTATDDAEEAAEPPPITGILLERFPDGSTRETVVEDDPEAWAAIHAGLEAVADRFAALTEADVAALVAAVCVPVDRCGGGTTSV